MSELHRKFPGLQIEMHQTSWTAHCVVIENRYPTPTGADWEPNGDACTLHVFRDGVIAEIREYYVPAPEDRAGDGVSVMRLAQEHAALRRVSGLVARGCEPDEVFAAVGREIGALLVADGTSLTRFESDDTVGLVSRWHREGTTHPAEGRKVDHRVLLLSGTREPLRFDTLPDDSPLLGMAGEFDAESIIALPLPVKERQSVRTSPSEPCEPLLGDRGHLR